MGHVWAWLKLVRVFRLDDSAGGLRVGPGGADFDEHVLQLGSTTAVRAALSVDFPRT